MSTVLRSLFALAVASCLLPAITYAEQLRQPASVLPLACEKTAKHRGIVAPQVDEVPQWLLQAAEKSSLKSNGPKKIASRIGRRSSSSVEKALDAAIIGEIEYGEPRQSGVGPTKKYRPKISPSEKSPQGPVLRIPGVQQPETTPATKRG